MSKNMTAEGEDFAARQHINAIIGERLSEGRKDDILFNFANQLTPAEATQLISGLGSVETSDGHLILHSGNGVGIAQVESVDTTRLQSGRDIYCLFTAAFVTPDADAVADIGIGDGTDGYFLRSTDGNLFAVRAFGGSEEVAEVRLPGALNIDQLNIYRIGFAGLGDSPAYFNLYSGPDDGWVRLHIFDLLNKQMEPATFQNALPAFISITKSAGLVDTTLRCSALSCGRVGGSDSLPSDRCFPELVSVSLGASTFQPLISLKSKIVFNGKRNHTQTILDLLTIATDGTKSVDFTLIKNGVLTGDSFTDKDITSIIEVDVAATVITGGQETNFFPIAKVDSMTIGQEILGTVIHPGDTITIAAESQNASDIDVGVRWREQF